LPGKEKTAPYNGAYAVVHCRLHMVAVNKDEANENASAFAASWGVKFSWAIRLVCQQF
jgi:hypothetical protein